MENVRVKFAVNFNETEKEKIREAVKEILGCEENKWLKEKYEREEISIYSSLRHVKTHTMNVWKACVSVVDSEPRYPDLFLPAGFVPEDKKDYIHTKKDICTIILPGSVFPWIDETDDYNPVLNNYFYEGI